MYILQDHNSFVLLITIKICNTGFRQDSDFYRSYRELGPLAFFCDERDWMLIEIRIKLAEIVNFVWTCTEIITKCCKKAEFLLIATCTVSDMGCPLDKN